MKPTRADMQNTAVREKAPKAIIESAKRRLNAVALITDMRKREVIHNAGLDAAGKLWVMGCYSALTTHSRM